jgi:hypothetical protein
MAVLAGDPKLPAMHIGVTIRAGGAHFRKFQALVATGAFNNFMGAYQQKAGFFVFKIHRVFHFKPGGGAVAAFAVPFNRTMRVIAAGLRPNHRAKKQWNNQKISLLHCLIPLFNFESP